MLCNFFSLEVPDREGGGGGRREGERGGGGARGEGRRGGKREKELNFHTCYGHRHVQSNDTM